MGSYTGSPVGWPSDSHFSNRTPVSHSYPSTQGSVRCRPLPSSGRYEQFHSLAHTYRRKHRPRLLRWTLYQRRCPRIQILLPHSRARSAPCPRYARRKCELEPPYTPDSPTSYILSDPTARSWWCLVHPSTILTLGRVDRCPHTSRKRFRER